MEDLFGDRDTPDPLGRRADHRDGARSILVGMAANRSFETGLPVQVDDLVGDLGTLGAPGTPSGPGGPGVRAATNGSSALAQPAVKNMFNDAIEARKEKAGK